MAPKPRSRPASAYATANTPAAIPATAVSGSGTRESNTWDATESVTTSAVKSAARAALSCVPDTSMEREFATASRKRSLKPGRPAGQRPGIRPLRNRSTKIWWSARARAP